MSTPLTPGLAEHPPPTEAAQLRAAGHTLTLTDGRVVTVRFTFAAVMEVENRLGSMAHLAMLLASHITGRVCNAVAEVVSIMTGEPVATVAGLLDPAKVVEYASAMDQALDEAMPKVVDGEVGKVQEPPPGGPSSTTSPPSSITAPTTSSGG